MSKAAKVEEKHAPHYTHYLAGCAAKEQRDFHTALEQFTAAVNLNPNEVSYRMNLALAAVGCAKSSEPYYEVAYFNAQEGARIGPDKLGAWIVLGEVCLAAMKFPEAIAAYEKACSMEDNHSTLWGLLAFAHGRNGQPEQALNAGLRSVELDPENGNSHFLLSSLFYEKMWNPERLAYHGERAFEAQKKALMALEGMWNAAHGFLTIGNYKRGWTYFEARLHRNATNMGQLLACDRYKKPLWRGEKVKRLLVQHEMGYGDAFCMLRYLTMLATKDPNMQILAEFPVQMGKLIAENYPKVTFVPYGSAKDEDFDAHIPILSLPYVMNTMSYSVPYVGPYIRPNQDLMNEWAEKLNLLPGRLNVGICWFSGRNSHSADNHHTSKRKSLTYEQIKPILDVPRVNFISLQAERDAEFPNPGIRDFADTAAIMQLCDIVISVDTAVANLAGAMGLNLWLMDRYDHDWRWSDIKTPWFPTAKIYRQEKSYVWNPVVEKIRDDLIAARDKMGRPA